MLHLTTYTFLVLFASLQSKLITIIIFLIAEVIVEFTIITMIKYYNIIGTQTIAQDSQEPKNITRTEEETDVFIPCPFEHRSTAPIWRINGTDYTIATLPSIYSLSSSGLFINRVDKCLDQTTFQCIDTSDSRLEGQESSVGTLQVTLNSQEQCTSKQTGVIILLLLELLISVHYNHAKFDT